MDKFRRFREIRVKIFYKVSSFWATTESALPKNLWLNKILHQTAMAFCIVAVSYFQIIYIRISFLNIKLTENTAENNLLF